MNSSMLHPMIAISGVSKHFGAVKAVDDVTFTVGRGEFFAMLGPSGCGKTTLLRMLAGFDHPTRGEIFIDGEPTAGIPPNRRPTNIVFQNYAIFPHLNVRQNIAYGLLNKKLSKAEIRHKVEEMLALIRLPGYGDRASTQLSGGQRQRVALARALVCEPKVLLLDEPLGALDKQLRGEMQIELRQIQRSVGITFIFVTHDQEEALTMADRVAMMSRGRVIQVDTANNLYERPVSSEVADFVGTANLFPGKAGEIGDIVTLNAGPLGSLHVPRRDAALRQGDDIVIAVRPEKLRLSEAPPPAGFNGLRGRIVAQSYVGDRTYHYLEIPGSARRLAVASLNERVGSPQIADGGRDQWVVWPVESGILLTS
jgi:ABC-type Fe3+/spermidine/putrescine transport system ATPase subunit